MAVGTAEKHQRTEANEKEMDMDMNSTTPIILDSSLALTLTLTLCRHFGVQGERRRARTDYCTALKY